MLIKKVLLAEDNEINEQVARVMLERLGLGVDTAWNGLEALEQYDPDKHDLIIMDLNMPIMGGLEATQKLFERYPDPRPKVIALTANAFEETRRTCLEAGMMNFLTKPLRFEVLKQTLEHLVSPSQRAEAENSDIDFALFDSLMGGETGELCRPIFDEFVEEMKSLSLVIEQLWTTGQVDEFIRAAHSAKGSTGTFGLARVSKQLSRIEQQAKAGQTELETDWAEHLNTSIEDGLRILIDRL